MSCIRLLLIGLVFLPLAAIQAGTLTIAAAADLKFAMGSLITTFRKDHPTDTIEATYGSSGAFYTQIRQGAPFDLFFSADKSYPEKLAQAGLAASDVKPYARGRLVLWSARRDASRMKLADLVDPTIRRIAIANPKHAPYGRCAEEVLRKAGLWSRVEPRLVYGENIAQTTQLVASGNADVGLIALSLASQPELARQGGYFLIPENLHAPLEQGYIITRHGKDNPLAAAFAAFMATPAAREVLNHHGFALPEAR
jgi:molybdate transport system substrate-binding protein